MKIYDISQEVFGCQVYPDDPTPEKKMLKSMENGEVYNLTAFNMCAHNGTHIDAPSHFIKNGKGVDEIPLESFVVMAFVAEHNGIVTANDATEIMMKEIVVEGLLSIQAGENPRIIEEKLKSFISPDRRKNIGEKEEGGE